jgi:NadR type nicotinamide-nucleotide adenylyltransferase
MKKIVLTGPESSGKTTLAELLAEYYQTLWVPEYARFYVEHLGRPYTELDLLNVAKEQIRQEDIVAGQVSNVLICDTDLITIKIWQQEKFGGTFLWLNQEIAKRHYDVYLLCHPDMPWEADPLRENPDDRYRLLEVYRKELRSLGKTIIEISGTLEERLRQATGIN